MTDRILFYNTTDDTYYDFTEFQLLKDIMTDIFIRHAVPEACGDIEFHGQEYRTLCTPYLMAYIKDALAKLYKRTNGQDYFEYSQFRKFYPILLNLTNPNNVEKPTPNDSKLVLLYQYQMPFFKQNH